MDRLETAGLVYRSRGTDRREVVITATTRGRDLQEPAACAQGQVAYATGLAPIELADLRRQLRVLADQLTPAT